MNSQDRNRQDEALSPAEQTLRMLAHMPAPEGLSARVQASLRTAPQRERLSLGGVFGLSGWMRSSALRTAAAMGIVCVVAGGGWQIYSHVQTSPGMQGVALPVHVNSGDSSQGGFSTSGAIAKPDPLKAPVITHQTPNPPQASSQPIQPERKTAKKKSQAKAAPALPEQR
jgi:hypothetical protein